MMKKLLTFAHRGEAQSFFEAFSFKPVGFIFDGLFESDQFFLLITGEGPHNASEKCTAVISKFNDFIDAVYNLGVAGSLNSKLIKNDLLWIRSAYAHHAERLEFKSYTSPLNQAHHDCITAHSRVLNKEERIKLSHFASVVDRELWAVASAASLFKLPFYAVKIISDSMEDESLDICKFVKLEAPSFSHKLLVAFKNQSVEKVGQEKEHKSASEITLLEDPSFYFTTSQKRKLISLLANLNLKSISHKDYDFQDIRNLELSPKDRSRELLQYLMDELNPMAKKIRLALSRKIAPLQTAAINISYDPDFESDWIQLSMKIQSSRDLEKIKNALKIFSYEEFQAVLNGNIE